MKLFALIVAASAALAPMQAFASTGSDQSPAQVQNTQPQPQVAWGDDDDQCDGLINICIDLTL
jgi:hypothetical protein